MCRFSLRRMALPLSLENEKLLPSPGVGTVGAYSHFKSRSWRKPQSPLIPSNSSPVLLGALNERAFFMRKHEAASGEAPGGLSPELLRFQEGTGDGQGRPSPPKPKEVSSRRSLSTG